MRAWMRARRRLLVKGAVGVSLVAVVVANVIGGGGGGACAGADVTTATFASRVSGAAAGDVLCLTTGSYGAFAGTSKTSPGITIKEQTGQTATFSSLTFCNGTDAWFTLDGITTTGTSIIGGDVDHITIRNSNLKKFEVYTENGAQAGGCTASSQMSSANLVFDGNLFGTLSGCGALEGRISLPSSGNVDAGVTISDNEFTGGDCDGIQGGAQGVNILNNWFHDIVYAGGGHTDTIQPFGASNWVIRGNVMGPNVEDGIVSYDCCEDNLTVTNNVMNEPGGTGGFTIVVGGVSNSLYAHNTLPPGGEFIIGGKVGEVSNGTTIENNIAPGGVSYGAGGASSWTNGTIRSNMCAGSCGLGTGNVNGSPTYVGGGSDPVAFTTIAEYALSGGSVGHLAANDGTDMGAWGGSGP